MYLHALSLFFVHFFFDSQTGSATCGIYITHCLHEFTYYLLVPNLTYLLLQQRCAYSFLFRSPINALSPLTTRFLVSRRRQRHRNHCTAFPFRLSSRSLSTTLAATSDLQHTGLSESSCPFVPYCFFFSVFLSILCPHSFG